MVGRGGRCKGISANPYDGCDVTLLNATLSGNFYNHAWIQVGTLSYVLALLAPAIQKYRKDSESLIKKSALVITPV